MDSNPSKMRRRLVYATHNAEHVDLNPAQRLAVQNLREQLSRLLKKRDEYATFIGSVSVSPLGLERRPTSEQQETAYELTQSYFEQVYATLSALASVHGRIRLHPTKSEPPINSNDKFLDWWEKVGREGQFSLQIEPLRAARDFRSVFMHPQMWPVFDWGTIGDKDDIRIMLHGAESSKGNIPHGSSRATSTTNWIFIAPDMDAVLSVFEQLCSISFGLIFTWYPVSEYATCTWEPDGIGSSIGDAAARTLRTALSGDNLSLTTKVRLAPDVLENLDDYIAGMTSIRDRAHNMPPASPYKTGIPAARPSLTLGPPFDGIHSKEI